MAANNIIATLTPENFKSDNRSHAVLGYRNNHPVLIMPDGTISRATATGWLSDRYDGGQIDVIVAWMADSDAGNARLEVSIERLENAGTDVDADAYGTAEAQTIAVPATSGVIKYSTWNLTAGELDSLVAGEMFRLMIRRIANDADATDTTVGKVYILGVKLVDNA